VPAFEDIQQMLDVSDGILLTGGKEAIDPDRFGEEPHPRVTWINRERDEFELRLLHAAIAIERPILGICRGMQLMNVALGGTLCQHLLDQRPTSLNHNTSLRAMVHEVEIYPNTRLSRIAGPCIRPEVNSAHFQGIDVPAPSVTVSAVAPDGTIEAIELTEYRFAIGVQWHPEDLAGRHRFSDNLFAEFIAAANGEDS
jgi:gamma-glutamyl-gamma-aminobutyrate hydrolase PuuD